MAPSFQEWPIRRLGTFAKAKGGKRLPAGHRLTNESTAHPYIRIVDYSEGRIDPSNLLYVPDATFPKIARYTIGRNDLFISIVGTVGLVAHVPRELDGASLTENAAKICSIDGSVDSRYLSYFLRSETGQSQIASLTVGSTQPKLALFRIEQIQVPCPPLHEQLTIASILGVLDDKIGLNRRMSATLEAIARALFKSWFVDFDPVRAKAEGRDTGLPPEIAALFPDSFVSSSIGDMPRGWNVGPISQVASVASGKRPQHRSSSKSSEYEVAVWGGNGPMAYTTAPLISEPILLTGRVGTLGSVFRISKPIWPSDNTLVISPKLSFFEYVFFSLRGIDYTSLNRGSTQPLLTQGDLNAQRITIPPDTIVKQFSSVVSALFLRIDSGNEESDTLVALRDTLLPKLISGQLRVSDAERVVENS